MLLVLNHLNMCMIRTYKTGNNIMKVIIAGSRSINDYNVLTRAIIDADFRITEIVSGGARGVDKLGEQFADRWNIPLKIFPANWELHGKSAGYKRNAEMAAYADGLIALWDGESKGTKHMIDLARKAGLQVYISNI